MLKRLIDIVGAIFGLIILSPILVMTAIMVRLKIDSPVFFVQKRPGLHGKPFKMIKFRTMTNAKDENSLALDLYILAKTIGKVLAQSDVGIDDRNPLKPWTWKEAGNGVDYEWFESRRRGERREGRGDSFFYPPFVERRLTGTQASRLPCQPIDATIH